MSESDYIETGRTKLNLLLQKVADKKEIDYGVRRNEEKHKRRKT